MKTRRPQTIIILTVNKIQNIKNTKMNTNKSTHFTQIINKSNKKKNIKMANKIKIKSPVYQPPALEHELHFRVLQKSDFKTNKIKNLYTSKKLS